MSPNYFIKIALGLPRPSKIFLMVLNDLFLTILSIYLSFVLRHGEMNYLPVGEVFYIFLISPLLALPIFSYFGIYMNIVRYIESKTINQVIRAVSVYSLVLSLMIYLINIENFPRSVIFINWLILILFIGGSRVFARSLFLGSDLLKGRKIRYKNVLIYGAGDAGAQLANTLRFSNNTKPVAFIDDNNMLGKHRIMGLKIYKPSEIGVIKKKYKVSEVLLAIPSLRIERRNEILRNLSSEDLKIKTIPSLNELLRQGLKISDLNFVDTAKLLGRKPFNADKTLLNKTVKDKVVLITGAGGSIGSELCRQISIIRPKHLILFDLSEFSLFNIHEEILKVKLSIKLTPVLGNILEKNLIENLIKTYKVETIYHAAAYKHVPMVEYNISMGVKNNVLGTYNLALCAQKLKVENFVLISTDKAIRPTNVMGASKRLTEKTILALSGCKKNATKFSIVRFGNVLGSSGSVIPKFKSQIASGGPITVTHPEIERYFMTIQEAAQLVIQAAAINSGGEVFVLNMGDPIKINDLATQMVLLSGKTIKNNNNKNGDIEITYSGLRPGEKLYEELFWDDNYQLTNHKLIFRAKEKEVSLSKLQRVLEDLKKYTDLNQDQKILETIKEYMPEFKHNKVNSE